ncbi:MAG: arabinose operon regulatory protein [Paenibacillaceae bacterium]|jgi:AraC family transcriptional regulator of arabinose operon|nr:arabinose operon regulatory protein [Paenibacillaceae bacterium]
MESAIKIPVELENNKLLDTKLHIRWINEWKRPPEYSKKPVDYPYTLCWLVLSGAKTVVIENRSFRVQEGDFISLPPHTPISVAANPGDEEFHYLALAGELKLGIFDLVSLYEFPHIHRFSPLSIERLLSLWRKLIEQVKHLAETTPDYLNRPISLDKANHYFEMNMLLHSWILEWIHIYTPILPKEKLFEDSRVHKVCKYINKSFKRNLKLRTLSKHVYLSDSHLRSLFRKYLGLTPMEYVQQVRISHAKQFLVTTSATVAEIAQMVGFSDQSQLGKVFRKEMGMSPLQYRKQSK